LIPAFLVIASLLFFSCAEEADLPRDSRALGPRLIIPEPSNGIELASAEVAPVSVRQEDAVPLSKVELSPDQRAIRIEDHNLDNDEIAEQVIAFKRRDDLTDLIRVMVIDFDSVRNAYIVTWEGQTRATNERNFTLDVIDLIGDQQMEILTLGMDADGKQTLDAFQRTAAPNTPGLFFRPIASLESTGTIEVQEVERSDAYEIGQTRGDSFPIIVYGQDPDSENALDLIRRTLVWRSAEDRYVLESEETIPGGQIEEEQLTELFNSDFAAFESFLDGPWYRVTGGASPPEATDLLFIHLRGREIIFSSGETQEAYSWENTFRTVYSGVQLRGINEAEPSLSAQINVRVQSIDEIVVSQSGDDSWDGVYRRLTSGLQSVILDGRSNEVPLADLELQGLYQNDSGDEIFFSPPRYRLQRDDETLSGGFVLYRLEDFVLQLSVVSEQGLVRDKQTYIMSYNEQRLEDRIVRSIELRPAIVSVRGVSGLGSESFQLEQIEELD
jgi:hypothetical protein